MPEIDGISLPRTIRKNQKALPLLTLAFVDQRIDADLTDATLWKPVKLSELHNALISVFTAEPSP